MRWSKLTKGKLKLSNAREKRLSGEMLRISDSNRQSWSAFAKKSKQRPLKEDRDRSKRKQPVSHSISLSKKRIRSEHGRGRRSISAKLLRSRATFARFVKRLSLTKMRILPMHLAHATTFTIESV